MQNNSPFVTKVNELLAKLEHTPTVDTGIELANQFVKLFGETHIKSVEDVFESSLELPNAERYDSWFQPHPIFKSDRACFELAETPLLQAKFYCLKKRSRQLIAGGVHFTPNYEDEEFTHNERYKVGLDFFLAPNGKSLQIVLSNRGNLRIVELSRRLNNTQREIFEKWLGAEELSSQEALHTTLWESFKLKSVNQKFYDGVSNSFTELLQHLKSIDKDEEEAKLFASRLLGRLLFCWFLRKKGIIDESIGYFNAQGMDATTYYKQYLERLFFLTLNTPIDERDELTKQHQKALFPELLLDEKPSLFKIDQKTPYLNGGLFEPHDNDWYKDKDQHDHLTLPEGFFTSLYDHFEEFNFTTDESSPEYEQIAIDPEMLGRVFESLLATQNDETGKNATKAKGTYYTPREIVRYMCRESLRQYLYNEINSESSVRDSVDSLLDISDSDWVKAKSNNIRDKIKSHRSDIIEALDRVTILDPACGSGAFPIGMLQLMVKTYERIESRFDAYGTKLAIIQNNLFGVDIEPMAVEIARLRAWLSLIVDESDKIDPLPNLDFKFVCANSLMPLDTQISLDLDPSLDERLRLIRSKYFTEKDQHKKDQLRKNYETITMQSTLLESERSKQLKSFKPFKNEYPAQFFSSEYMFGIKDGFHIVIGNPPYGAHLSDSEKTQYRKYYLSTKNIQGVQYGSLDSYVLFTELAYTLTRHNGVAWLIIPMSITSSENTTALQNLLYKNCSEIRISSYADRPQQIFQSAHQRVSIISFIRDSKENIQLLTTQMQRKDESTSIETIINNLEFININEVKFYGRIPKIGTKVELGIYKKLHDIDTKIVNIRKTSGIPIYYRSSGGDFYKIFSNHPTGSTKDVAIYFDEKFAGLMGSVLISSLYYWYQKTISNILDIKSYEINSFSVPLNNFNGDTIDKLTNIFNEFNEDIEKNALVRQVASSRTRVTSFKEYKLRKSKKYIDLIDNIVLPAYGLNDEEIEFIKNFEIKYRTSEE